MSNEYTVDTLVEMAAIPEEALPRFLAELPAILAEVRRMRAAAREFNDQFAGVLSLTAVKGSTWVDDDLGQVTTTIAMPDDLGGFVVTREMALTHG